jgi:hypothetical protein
MGAVALESAEQIDDSVMVIPMREWEVHKAKVELMVSVLAAVVGSLQATPFGGMIPPDVAEQISKVADL